MQKKVEDAQIISLLISGKTQTEISKEVGLSLSHLNRRIHRPDFQTQLTEYRKQIIQNTLTELTSHSQKAVRVLAMLMDAPNDFVKFNSASRILSLVQDYTCQVDLMLEIEQLKEQQN